ncbi:MAG: hypothetical protein JST39_04415 [Bacteroidetes bacterium]|nr:hypothetical protein [Bacteroidota bacterium]
MEIRLLIILLPLACSNITRAQDTPASGLQDTARLNKLTSGYIAAVGSKSGVVSRDIDKQTTRYLDKLQKQEAKLQKKVAKVDSLAAHNIFANSASKYQELQDDLKNKSARLQRSTGLYLPWSDTASNSLKFLSSGPLAGKLPVSPSQMKDAMGKVKELEAQLRQAENVKEFIRQRKDYLRQQLASYNLGSDLKKYNSTCYYYSQQLNDYKAALSDENKAEQKALSLLRQYQPFKDFMGKNGALAGLFNIPGDYASTGVGNLQTVNQVQNLISQRIGNLGPNGMQTVQASISAAQSELSRLRNRFPQVGDAADLPDFKPDQTKTKNLKNRLIFGFDMQTSKGNNFIPNYSDLGLSLGIRITDRFTAGLGASYKLGFGKDISHIRFSSEGLGLRSYVDWKIKKSFFLSGGGEFNYLSAFSSIKELQDYSAWKASALLGVSKTVSLKTKFFKNTKVSLLYDFLHAAQVPQSRALVFRAGYNF